LPLAAPEQSALGAPRLLLPLAKVLVGALVLTVIGCILFIMGDHSAPENSKHRDQRSHQNANAMKSPESGVAGVADRRIPEKEESDIIRPVYSLFPGDKILLANNIGELIDLLPSANRPIAQALAARYPEAY